MKAVFGLGNPGQTYHKTRHNAGFMVLDHLARSFFIPFAVAAKTYYIGAVTVEGVEVLLVKPATYMNRSGIIVEEIMSEYNIGPDDILVVYDDLHLPFGTLRLRPSGSDGGHNGIGSIIECLETSDFSRLRFGIGPNTDEDQIRFVLGDFPADNPDLLEQMLGHAAEAVKSWITEDTAKVMSRYNRDFL